MNPVDHVSSPGNFPQQGYVPDTILFYSLTVVVTTSTLVKPRLSPATPPRVRKPVSLLPAEPVCSVVPRRPPRSKCDMVWSFSFDGLKRLFCYDACVLRRLWTATHASLVNNENMWPKFVYRRLTISLFDRNYDTVWAENIEKKSLRQRLTGSLRGPFPSESPSASAWTFQWVSEEHCTLLTIPGVYARE